MAATPADIAAGTRRAQVLTWEDSDIQTRYPNARDGSLTPAEGFFDDAADADTVLAARGALIGVERRRFVVTAQDVEWPAPEDGLPTIALSDDGLAVDANHLPSRIEIDLEAETSTYGLFG